MNQCDGCQRGLPIEPGTGLHRDEQWCAMACTAGRYRMTEKEKMAQRQREAFERCHVVSDDATYNAQADEYRWTHHDRVNHPVNELYESFKDGAEWKATQAQQVPCPYPCGWEKLHTLTVKDAAFFARSTIEDDYPEAVRDAGIRLGQQAIELCRSAMKDKPAQQVPEEMLEIGRRLLEDRKDNDHCTADPLFVVQRKRLVAGIDTDYASEIGWIDEEGNLLDEEEQDQLEAAFDKGGEVPECYTRTGIAWEWEHVDTYLTPQSAHARVKGDADLRVYVESAHRNSEMRKVQDFLMSLAKTQEPSHE